MEVHQNEHLATAQGVGSPVPDEIAGVRAGPARPSSRYCTAPLVVDQARVQTNATGRKPHPGPAPGDFPTLKRTRISSPEIRKSPSFYNKFFIITRKTDTFEKTSPFLLHKLLLNSVGELEEVRKVKNGSIMILTKNKEQSEKIANMTHIGEFEIIVEPHRTLNSVKGVITCSDLLNCDTEEILDNMKDQGVIAVKRISTVRKGDTASLILTFQAFKLPERVSAGWYSLRVRPYIPAPLRCFNCQRFGHMSNTCQNSKLCPSCGKADHPEAPCSPPQFASTAKENTPQDTGDA